MGALTALVVRARRRRAAGRADLVPLAERLLYLRSLRIVLAIGPLLYAGAMPEVRRLGFGALGVGALSYLGAATALEAAFWRGRRRLPPLFVLLVGLDAAYLAWSSYATGGATSGVTSPVRYLVLVQVVAVALLSSYRTVFNLACWTSLLAWLVDVASPEGANEGGRTVTFLAAIWLTAVVTGTLSVVNEGELRRRRLDLDALAAVGHALEVARDAREVAEVLLDHVCGTFPVRRVLLLGAPDDELVLLGARGLDRVPPDCRIGSGSVLRAAAASHTTMTPAGLDPAADGWLAVTLPDPAQLLVTPLHAEGRAVGVLVVEHRMRPGSPVEGRLISMIERFAAQGALALRNAWLLARLQRIAATDGLTAIANRRSFDAALEREIARAARKGERVSVILLDIDHFKLLNDTHGHQAGDDVLRDIAALIDGFGREYDTVARYGGEEFAVVLPGCSPRLAHEVAERLRRAVAAAGTAVPVTTSAGVATFPVHAGDPRALLRAADEALYAAKQAGRNRVVTSSRLARSQSGRAAG